MTTIAGMARVALANSCKPLYSPRRTSAMRRSGSSFERALRPSVNVAAATTVKSARSRNIGEASASGVVVVNDQDLLTHVVDPGRQRPCPIALVNCLMRRETSASPFAAEVTFP